MNQLPIQPDFIDKIIPMISHMDMSGTQRIEFQLPSWFVLDVDLIKEFLDEAVLEVENGNPIRKLKARIISADLFNALKYRYLNDPFSCYFEFFVGGQPWNKRKNPDD